MITGALLAGYLNQALHPRWCFLFYSSLPVFVVAVTLSLSSEIDYSGAAPYALIMIVLSLPMTYVLFSQSKKAAGL